MGVKDKQRKTKHKQNNMMKNRAKTPKHKRIQHPQIVKIPQTSGNTRISLGGVFSPVEKKGPKRQTHRSTTRKH